MTSYRPGDQLVLESEVDEARAQLRRLETGRRSLGLVVLVSVLGSLFGLVDVFTDPDPEWVWIGGLILMGTAAFFGRRRAIAKEDELVRIIGERFDDLSSLPDNSSDRYA